MNKQEILQYVGKKFTKKTQKKFRVGDTLRVHVNIKEGNTSRVQVFEGVVIAIKGNEDSKVFTIRKVSFGIGVERVFPVNSPVIDKIQIIRSSRVRRAKLYFLRSRSGKAARLEEREIVDDSKKAPKVEKDVSKKIPPQELVGAKDK